MAALRKKLSKDNRAPPPYRKRGCFRPINPEDFGDGGAFPEFHFDQYPLEMGKKKTRLSALRDKVVKYSQEMKERKAEAVQIINHPIFAELAEHAEDAEDVEETIMAIDKKTKELVTMLAASKRKLFCSDSDSESHKIKIKKGC